MVFECLDRSFGCIDTMVVWFHELPLYILAGDVVLDRFGALVVGDIELWFVTLP